jgi:hypothetical protein
VKAHQQRRAGLPQAGSEPGQLRRPGLFGRLHFEIHNLAAGLGGCQQYLKLSSQGPHEVAAKLLAPAGGDSRHVAVICQKLLHLGL